MKPFTLPVAVLAAFGAVSCFAQSNVTVVNYSGYSGDFPVAPGSIASAYGQFGSITTTAASSVNPLPKELAGVRVRINNIDAPLYFVSSSQINLVVPGATPLGRQVVEVVSGGSIIAGGIVNVYEIGPGLASLQPTDPNRPGIIQNQNSGVNSSSARARKGEVVQIWSTGCGTVNPQIEDGVPPSNPAPATASVKVYFGYEEAQVQFAGAQTQYPGICQVNAFVPQNLPLSGLVPVFINVNGVNSNPVTLWVE